MSTIGSPSLSSKTISSNLAKQVTISGVLPEVFLKDLAVISVSSFLVITVKLPNDLEGAGSATLSDEALLVPIVTGVEDSTVNRLIDESSKPTRQKRPLLCVRVSIDKEDELGD